MGKVFPFASPLHIPSGNKRFQQRAGSANRYVLSYKRGRRCLVALSACETLKDQQTGILFAIGKVLPSHPCAYTELAKSASGDELEAPIAAF